MASEGPSKKKSRVDEESATTEEEDIKPILDELEPLEQQLVGLIQEEETAIREVNKEYNRKRAPIFKKRGEIVSKIPGFWLRCFENHVLINGLIEDDKEILKHLVDVWVEDLEGPNPAWKITFTFEKNPFFSTTTLWKEFHWQPEEEEIKVTGNQIEWHKGKNPKQKKKKEKKDKKDKKGKKRSHDEEGEDEETRVSFFDWFDPADTDDSLGEIIRNELWPNAIGYFLGQVDADDDDDDDDDGEAGEGGEGEGGEGGGDDGEGEGGDD